jgi:hypothetical protein
MRGENRHFGNVVSEGARKKKRKNVRGGGRVAQARDPKGLANTAGLGRAEGRVDHDVAQQRVKGHDPSVAGVCWGGKRFEL